MEIKERQKLHADCRIFDVFKRRFQRKSDGVEGDFFVLDTNDWVNVLAITPKQELVLVRQFRYGSQEFSLSNLPVELLNRMKIPSLPV